MRSWSRAVPIAALLVTSLSPAPATAAPIVDGGRVYAGMYSALYGDRAAADLNGMAAWAGQRATFSGSFHDLMENTDPATGQPYDYSNTINILEAGWDAQATPFANVAAQTSAADLASGAWDRRIADWAGHVKTWLDMGEGRSVLIAPLQEMNWSASPWSRDPGNYRTVYAKFRAAFANLDIDETHVRWVFAPNNVSDVGLMADYYPGDDVVDVIAFSGYNFGSKLTFDHRFHTVPEVIGPAMEEIRNITTDKPVMLAQTASSSDGGDKDQWIRDLFAAAAADPLIVGLIWFNIQKETDWPVWNGQTGNQGWVDALNSSTTSYDWPLEDWFRPGPLQLGGAPVDDIVRRIAGDSRIATAVALSKEARDATETVVIARSDTFPDALAGAPLAVALDAPILLTRTAGLDPQTRDEILRLGATTAYLLGGESALSPQVEEDLARAGIDDVIRVADDSRFGTAAAIGATLASLRRAGGSTHAFVVEGANPDPGRGWPDAVSVSPLAAFLGDPILLVERDQLPADTAAAIEDLGIETATIVGGAGAVSGAVEQRIERLGVGVDRVSGDSRFATSAAVASLAVDLGMKPTHIWVATGGNWPDALAAAPTVVATGGVMVLVDGGNLDNSPQTRDWISQRRSGLIDLTIVGGTGAVSATVESQLSALVS